MILASGITAILIAKNASKTIKDTLTSLDFCDQVTVLDSGSSDNTVAIALSLGAQVIETDWQGFGIQKHEQKRPPPIARNHPRGWNQRGRNRSMGRDLSQREHWGSHRHERLATENRQWQ